MRQTLVRLTSQYGYGGAGKPNTRFGHSQTLGMLGNIGQGRHFDPTNHMTLEQMRKKSIVYQDVYLDGYENSFWADRNAFRILSPEGAKKMRYYRTAWINRRFFNYMLFLCITGYAVVYIVMTFRYLGVGMRINNYFHEKSDTDRHTRETAAIENCPEYIPALVDGYKKLMAPEHLSGWANYEVADEWIPIPDRTGHPNEDNFTVPTYSYLGLRT